MTFWKWSQTAANNGVADSTCPFPEGMAPSAVNDSARGMMAAAAKYRDDIAGAIVTTGSPTAYAVSSYEIFDTLAHLDGMMIAFTPHATCGATVTLNVDLLGAKPLRSSAGVEIPAGTLIQGTPYAATYNNTAGAFYLHGFYGSPYNIPLGGMMPYLGSTAPNSAFVLPYGQAISRTTYQSLWTLVGTAFGSGDGSTTFNVPDLRGRVPVGLDNMGGTAAGTITAAGSGAIGTLIGAQSKAIATNEMPSHQHNVYLKDPGHTHTVSGTPGGVPEGPVGNPYYAASYGTVTTSTNMTGVTIGSTSGTASDNLTAATGGATPFSLLQPSVMVPWILRVI